MELIGVVPRETVGVWLLDPTWMDRQPSMVRPSIPPPTMTPLVDGAEGGGTSKPAPPAAAHSARETNPSWSRSKASKR
jgi:hypothetical protein